MIQVLVVGAGGHAQVITDAMLRAQEDGLQQEPVGFLDDNPALLGDIILGLRVLGSIDELHGLAHDGVIIAIGANATRASLFDRLLKNGEQIVNVIHPMATLAVGVKLGRGVQACAGAIVNTGTRIGDNTIINTGATIDHHTDIAAHCHIAPGVHLGGGVQVGEGAFLGIGAVVIPGCRVGRWATVGAGAVVTRDIPDDVTAVGVPAKVIKMHRES